MATPTTPERRLLAAGAAKAADWGTAVALGANMGMLIEDIGGMGAARNQSYVPAKEADTPYPQEGDLGLIDPVEINPKFFMRYDPGKIGTLLALLFGTAGVPTQQGTTAAYKHVFQWADSIYGKFATIAAEFPGKIYEIASAKVIGFELTIENGFIKGTLSLRGNIEIDDSSVNTATQMDALTYVDRGNRIKFPECSIKMNAESGGDVSSENALEVSGVSIKYSRIPDGPYVAGSKSIIEPNEEGLEGATIHLDFPRMNSDNAAYFQSCFSSETEQKMLIAFQGATIEDTYKYELNLFFPRLRMLKPTYSWEEIVKAGLDLVAEEASAAPTGMDYARLYAQLQNKQTTDYLA